LDDGAVWATFLPLRSVSFWNGLELLTMTMKVVASTPFSVALGRERNRAGHV